MILKKVQNIQHTCIKIYQQYQQLYIYIIFYIIYNLCLNKK